MANQGRPSYRLNLNRNPTQKWAKAERVDYGGDDWGDEDYDDYPEPEPQSAVLPQRAAWGPGNTAQRSFTNPMLASGPARTPFDREDERRHVSAAGYDPRQQGQPQQGFDSATGGYPGPPSLEVKTQTSGPPQQSVAQHGARGNQQTDVYGVPYSAPVAHIGDRFYSNIAAMQQGSRDYNTPQTLTSSRFDSDFGRPQKTVEHSVPPLRPEMPIGGRGKQTQHTVEPDDPHVSTDVKPLPFPRPAEIYKRLDEEREKERLSQESSRPSIDSTTSRTRGSSLRSTDLGQSISPKPQTEQADADRTPKTALGPVKEHKGDHDIDSKAMGDGTTPLSTTQPSSHLSPAMQDQQHPAFLSRASSSAFTDRTGPVSIEDTKEIHFPAVSVLENTPTTEPLRRTLYDEHSSNRQPRDSTISSTSDAGDLPNFEPTFTPPPRAKASDNNTIQLDGNRFNPSVQSSRSENLQHQPSLGYKSVVEQAFDAEGHSNLSPSNTADTLPRSNSTSTAEISPIISKGSDRGNDTIASLIAPPQTISEESTPPHDRNEPSATVQNTEPSADTSILPATTFQPGFRRDKSPSTEEGAARRPLSVQIPEVPDAQHGVLSTVTSSNSTVQDPATETLPATQYTPTPRGLDLPKQQSLQGDLAPSPTSRSTSEDWRDWESQRRNFNAKHGIEDSNTASPAMSASISRAESPAKGKVRDMADRLESKSSLPLTVTLDVPDAQVAHPQKPPQARTANPRPSLPGAWMSDTTTVSSIDAREDPEQPSNMMNPSIDSRTTSTESIPTAVAPKNWRPSKPDTIEAAFAAAAAAGNALAGSFSGAAFSRNSQRYSESASDKEPGATVANTQQHNFSDTRDFASSASGSRTQPTGDDFDDAITPRQTSAADHAGFHGRTNEPVGFPAPLRMARNTENREPSPRLSIPPVSPVRDHEESDPLDQLQEDIVKSLTPKPSALDETTIGTNRPPVPTGMTHQDASRDSIVSSDDDVLPQEYSSYWDEPEMRPAQKKSLQESSANDLTPTGPKAPLEPGAATAVNPVTDSKPPFLEHRYSWETPAEHDKPAEPAVSLNVADDAMTRSSVTPQSTAPSSILASSLDPVISRIEDAPVQEAINPKPTTLPSSQITNLTVASTFPHERNNFRSILALKDSPSRIRGFDENRRILAEPNGLLDHWLSSMKNSDHADIFTSSRLPQMYTTPRRNSKIATPQSDQTAGTKQMQEDGKRLLAAAGKYGGKAGTAAKGLFARGKEKFRTTSASDKVSLTSRQRSNTMESVTSLTPPQPMHPTQPTQAMRPMQPMQPMLRSTLPETAPQLPTPTLDTTSGEASWSTLFLDRSQQTPTGTPRGDPPTAPQPSLTTNSGTGTGSAIMLNAAKQDTPPPSVVAALPGNNKTTPSSQTLPKFENAVKIGSNYMSDKTLRGLDDSAVQDNRLTSAERESGQQSRDQENAPSLPVPRERRPSSISDVSDVSPVPDDRSETHPRNVSPTLENQHRQQPIPVISTQASAKETEAAQDRTSFSEGTLPPYSSARNSAAQQRHNQAAPGSLIVPLADLKGSDAGDDTQAGARPFSFVGSETLNHAQASQHQRANEAVRSGTGNYAPTNYSQIDGPKTPQVNIAEHPAYRAPTDARSEAEPVNPLPSSRRSPREIEQALQRQHQPQLHLQSQSQSDEASEGYRIPGPYGQQYRSPRHSKPFPAQDHVGTPRDDYSNRPEPPASMEMSRPDEAGHRAPPTSYSGQSRPEYDRNKSRSFGLFRSRSRSQTRDQGQDFTQRPTQSSENFVDENKRRKGLFGFGNRTSSPVPQVNEGRNDATARPDAGRGRKLSMDMLRSSAFGSKTQTDSKKKRSSGIGAFFGKSSGRDKEDGRLERNPSAPLSRGPMQTFDSYTQSPQQAQGPMPGVMDQQRFQAASPDPISQFPRPPVVQKHGSGKSESAYQETQAYSTASGHHSDYDHTNSSWRDTEERSQAQETIQSSATATIPGASHPNHYMVPQEHYPRPKSKSPPVPVTRANKDISYGQDRPYVPPTSPRPQIVSAIPEPKSEMANHVKNLHTRSRSPRLGRPPSDEFPAGTYDDSTGSSTTQKLSPDPTRQLGTFSNKKISPQGGVERPNEDQEKPWIISLPNENETDGPKTNVPRHDQRINPKTSGPRSAVDEPATVSPTMSSHRDQSGNFGGVISPVTTRETSAPDFHPIVPVGSTAVGSRAAVANKGQGSERRDHAFNKPQGGTSTTTHDPTIAFPAPPSISNSNVIPLPNAKPGVSTAEATKPSTGTMGMAEKATPRSPEAPPTSKRILLERATNVPHDTSSAPSKPLTVAERVLGIQPAARGTMPEHRSTTPVPHSPAPSVGNQPKTATWPDGNPSTTAVKTSQNGATTVTKTTMTSGSKGQKGGIKTSTYVIDSGAPSRTASKAGSDKSSIHNSSIRNSTDLRASQKTAEPSQRNLENETPLSPVAQAPAKPGVTRKNDYGKSFDAVELPGSKPDGYESEEEIVMSATAYPGQEWMPDYAQGWED